MKKTFTMALMGASALALMAGSAMAQPSWAPGHWLDDRGQWVNVNQRQQELNRRIDQGVRSGQITRAEALRLRAEFQTIARLETRYRVGGLSLAERADLDRRFDALAMRIRWERADNQHRNDRWVNINQRQRELDRRIDAGVRSGQINRAEAVRLRSEFQAIARLEARYRANGLSAGERADLDRRFDVLAARIRWERNDRDYGMGYGNRR